MLITDITEESLKGITLIYGPASTGKTTIALEALRGRSIYISTHKNFNVDRLKAMRADADKIIEKLVLFEAHDLLSVEKSVKTAVQLSHLCEILVVDSIATHIRSANKKLGNLALHRILEDLKHAACPVLITSEVYDYLKEAGNHQFVGGDMLRLASNTIIELKEGMLTVKKHAQHTGRSWQYIITGPGVRKA
jgi:AAA+ ATPase superfamily predicted ATPase